VSYSVYQLAVDRYIVSSSMSTTVLLRTPGWFCWVSADSEEHFYVAAVINAQGVQKLTATMSRQYYNN